MKKLPIIMTLLLSATAFADETYPRVVPAKDVAEVLERVQKVDRRRWQGEISACHHEASTPRI
jgi:hypothetical protein